jgi:molybdopterin-guanine dinucleotide biosynthesis protein A
MGTGTDKAFLSLGPKPVIAWSLLAFESCTDIDQIVLVAVGDLTVFRESEKPVYQKVLGCFHGFFASAAGTQSQGNHKICYFFHQNLGAD